MEKGQYDYLIIGAGLFGSVFAYSLLLAFPYTNIRI